MPIKFRCPHCQQLLGIAVSKAASIVDCPTCGRAVRVPTEDGATAPLPEPELNLEDARLVEALDELAALGDAGEVLPLENVSTPAEVPPRPAPPPRSAPRPIELPPPPVAVPLAPAPPVAPLAELRQMAPAVPPERVAATHVIPGHPTWGQRLLILALGGLLGFAAGWGAARGLRTPTPAAPPRTPASDSPPPAAAVVAGPRLQGRVSYRTEAGEILPDADARVLVFPLERQGTVRLSVDGFRAGESPENTRVAQAAWQVTGGLMALVGADGQYALDLPRTGTYVVLILSRHQRRNPDARLEPRWQKLLESYFDRPAALLGQLAADVVELKTTGAGPALLDHAFAIAP